MKKLRQAIREILFESFFTEDDSEEMQNLQTQKELVATTLDNLQKIEKGQKRTVNIDQFGVDAEDKKNKELKTMRLKDTEKKLKDFKNGVEMVDKSIEQQKSDEETKKELEKLQASEDGKEESFSELPGLSDTPTSPDVPSI